MPSLVWDNIGDRTYESGLDRGVLYLPDGTAVPWNGLTSVIENFDKSTSPVYFDGMKINDLAELGNFSASLKAITYPDEFVELEGNSPVHRGIFVGDQKPQIFGLSYRTRVGDDVAGPEAGYKIHILYNVTAIPSSKTSQTLAEVLNPEEFEWTLTAVPEEFPGFRPTAHIVIDTADVDPWLIEELEEILYGGTYAEASLIPMLDLLSFVRDWYRVKIINNGDGTWTAISRREGFISISPEQIFSIVQVNAVYINDYTYIIADTKDIFDVPLIKIFDNGDGTWSATTDDESLISITDGVFQILQANEVMINPDTYRIRDTAQT